MRGELRVLNHTGDTVMEWDTEQKNGPLDPEYVKAEFERLTNGGYMAFQTQHEGGRRTGEQIKKGEFDPTVHDRVILTPGFVGG